MQMEQIEVIYSEFCKRHETAVLKFQEVENDPEKKQFFTVCLIKFFKECRIEPILEHIHCRIVKKVPLVRRRPGISRLCLLNLFRESLNTHC